MCWPHRAHDHPHVAPGVLLSCFRGMHHLISRALCPCSLFVPCLGIACDLQVRRTARAADSAVPPTVSAAAAVGAITDAPDASSRALVAVTGSISSRQCRADSLMVGHHCDVGVYTQPARDVAEFPIDPAHVTHFLDTVPMHVAVDQFQTRTNLLVPPRGDELPRPAPYPEQCRGLCSTIQCRNRVLGIQTGLFSCLAQLCPPNRVKDDVLLLFSVYTCNPARPTNWAIALLTEAPGAQYCIPFYHYLIYLFLYRLILFLPYYLLSLIRSVLRIY